MTPSESRRPARRARCAAAVVATGLAFVVGACGDDGAAPDTEQQASVAETTAPADTPTTESSATTAGPPVTAADAPEDPDGASDPEIDEAVLRRAHEDFARQFRMFAAEAFDRPLDEFAAAVLQACRAVAEGADATPDERAAAVDESIERRDGIAGWRGAAVGVTTQYFFLGGCEVPDRDAVVEALATRITEAFAEA